MPDYSKQNQFELAELKLKDFETFLDELGKDKAKKDEAIEGDKQAAYYDFPPFGWSDFSKFLVDKCFSTQNILMLVEFLEELKRKADICIDKYSTLMGANKKEVKKAFADFPHRDKTIDYSGLSFLTDIDFSVKTSNFADRYLPLLIKGINHYQSSPDIDSLNTQNHLDEGSNTTNEEKDKSSNLGKNNPEISTQSDKETIFHGDQELADYLECSKITIWKLKRAKELPLYKVGRKYYYKQSEIDNAFRIQKLRKRKH
jgi:excisionase family DNA binding protein